VWLVKPRRLFRALPKLPLTTVTIPFSLFIVYCSIYSVKSPLHPPTTKAWSTYTELPRPQRHSRGDDCYEFTHKPAGAWEEGFFAGHVDNEYPKCPRGARGWMVGSRLVLESERRVVIAVSAWIKASPLLVPYNPP
jgi:hypothetical protein